MDTDLLKQNAEMFTVDLANGDERWSKPLPCHSCRRKSWTEREHIGHQCKPWRVWLVKKWRQLATLLGLYSYGDGYIWQRRRRVSQGNRVVNSNDIGGPWVKGGR